MNLLKNLDWRELIAKLVSFATSELAREKLRNTEPLASAELATKSFDQIEALSQAFKEGYRPRMESLDLYSNWYQRLTRNSVLKILDIKDVRHFCIEALTLKEVCIKFEDLYFKEIESEIMDAEAPIAAIDDIMTSDGEIRSDASDKLRSLNAEKNHLARQVQLALDRLVKDFQIEHLLQDKYVTTREGRWVLPIKSGMQHGFDGVIHDASQSKQTVFMEPKEILPINNRLRQIEIEIALEIERILIELSSYLKSLRFEFENTQKVLLISDTQFAQSELATVLNASPCTFDSENFKLFDVRHPLLVFSSREVISNDLELNAEKRILILSGPNAGGKTVLLKSMGLAAHMARCGLPICARKDSALPFFKEIIVSIGDSQSVDSNMSTFAAHLTTLNSATKNRGPQSLLLIDEICGSTDPEEGAALARSFIDTYN
ncbi:MAG: endonuclease MutS2, partial [Bdellovibrionales bacterium]